MSTEDDLLCVAQHLAEIQRGANTTVHANDNDARKAEDFLQRVAEDPELQVALLRRVNRQAAIERAEDVAHVGYATLQNTVVQRVVDAVLMREERW